ncbi:MAG: ABC transporter permease [Actinomycetaceae bacterium]|nr:ABC transporter permease [Actinomycetaceae bacterium]
MFLAIREIRHSPARFLLITAVVFLVSYLTYFLTALAFGLASSYTEAIDQWDVRTVVLQSDANGNSLASRISPDTLAEIDEDDGQPLLLMPTVINLPDTAAGEDPRKSIFVFGLDMDGPLAPDLADGRFPTEGHEILLDGALRSHGFAIGDTIRLPESETTWTICGFTTGTRFQASPTVLMTIDQYRTTLLPELMPNPDALGANILVLPGIPGDPTSYTDRDLEVISIDDFIGELPGYNAQVLTFSLMIGSLIVIISFVLGIFVYVLTLQKKNIFGIMKAQGVRTSYIVLSGAMQTLLLTMSGVALGMALTVTTGVFLPETVPFRIEPTLYAAVTSAFVIFTLVGGLFPIRTISRIDPIEAIG